MRRRSLLLGSAGILAGFATWRLLLAILRGGFDPASPDSTGMAIRLGVAAMSLLPAAAVLAAMILVQMAARFWQGVFDPTAGADGRYLRVGQRVISNTVEQMAILGPALLALAAAVQAEWLPQVVALALVFALARLVFWVGYLIAPIWRAPGMAASIGVNLAALGWAFAVWIG